MASIIKGKVRIYPSGMSSIIYSHIPKNQKGGCGDSLVLCSDIGSGRLLWTVRDDVPAPLGSRAKLRQGRAATPEGRRDYPVVLPSGYGALGSKDKASWKSGRNVRERMAAIELEYGKNKCLLLTVTLPSISPKAYEALARYSSYAMDRLNREFNREFGSGNIARVSVWEYQKRGALHCHILIAGECIHAINPSNFSEKYCDIWHRILMDIGNKFDADMFMRKDGKQWQLSQLKQIRNKKKECVFVNCQKVYKSVVAYLSKYLSDSNHEEKEGDKNKLREKFYPIASWFQWNRKATELYDKYMDEFDLGECEPDKIHLIQSSLRKLKKDIERKIPLAKNTEVKSPKKPYVYGLYWIPENGNISFENSRLLSKYIGKIANIFKDDVAKQDRKKYQLPDIQYPIYPDLDCELAIREYELNCSISAWQSSDFRIKLDILNMWDYVVKFAIKGIDFFRQNGDNDINPIGLFYEQLELYLDN